MPKAAPPASFRLISRGLLRAGLTLIVKRMFLAPSVTDSAWLNGAPRRAIVTTGVRVLITAWSVSAPASLPARSRTRPVAGTA